MSRDPPSEGGGGLRPLLLAAILIDGWLDSLPVRCYSFTKEVYIMINYRNYISVNPEICHGQACFKNTRILVYMVLEMLEAGETIKGILRAYPKLTPRHIRAALHYAAEVIRSGEFFPFAKPK